MLANDDRPRTMHPEAERTGREPPTSDTPPSAAWTARLRPLQLAIWSSGQLKMAGTMNGRQRGGHFDHRPRC
jgi:hypothetical protein